MDRLQDRLDRRLVGGQVGGKTAFVADGGPEATPVQHGLQRMKDLGTVAHSLADAGRADRQDHELLEVHAVVRVLAAVDDVHHGHGQTVGSGRERHEERQRLLLRGGMRCGDRDTEQCVGAEAGFVVGPVERNHGAIERRLVADLHADDRVAQLALDVGDGGQDALAAEP